MLQIIVPGHEYWNEARQEFIQTKEHTLQLEHSLVSLSKWEAKWCKPYFSRVEKTPEEVIDYIRCMTITQNVKPEVYNELTQDNVNEIKAYIEAPMTATTFSDDPNARPNREIITSEIIYHWMIAMNIPLECQRWHLNRLMTLIKVCSIKNQPPKNMSRKQAAHRNAALNAARRKQFNTKG